MYAIIINFVTCYFATKLHFLRIYNMYIIGYITVSNQCRKSSILVSHNFGSDANAILF